jgi:two-component system response regulator FixJ
MTQHSVFVIDDDQALRDSLLMLLRGEGIRARGFASAMQFLEQLPDDKSACVITDLRMPQIEGSELIQRLKALKGEAWPVIVITGHADVPLAVQLMKAGVVDFIEKPFTSDRLLLIVARALEASRLRRENSELRLRAGPETELLGNSLPLSQLRIAIEKVAPTGSRVLTTRMLPRPASAT